MEHAGAQRHAQEEHDGHAAVEGGANGPEQARLAGSAKSGEHNADKVELVDLYTLRASAS